MTRYIGTEIYTNVYMYAGRHMTRSQRYKYVHYEYTYIPTWTIIFSIAQSNRLYVLDTESLWFKEIIMLIITEIKVKSSVQI